MKRVLALDFDGVIWDSVGECFVMARRVYTEMYGLPCSDLEAAFRRGRWLVRTGGDFLLVLQLAMADPEGDLTHFPKAEFEKLQRDKAAETQAFSKEFYALREKTRDEHWQEWLSFQQPYPLLLQQFDELRKVFDQIVVCTTKDTKSAQALLASAGLELPIYGKELAVHKGDQIKALCQQHGVEPTQIFFIDDLVENLDQVRPSGAACGLAAWGYNTAAERQRAVAAGYPVLEVFSLAHDLKTMLSEQCPSPG
ncbi:MAG: HAD family hydrolase [Candidatus Eremiobacteraeota bacterium]|nr:HAD family hydrolase [Candidatus Eremiobacteraeota bacterium]MCW5870429.1 HAD family hydrolase [Candidatus Eremiobacteraeota bacterium]